MSSRSRKGRARRSTIGAVAVAMLAFAATWFIVGPVDRHEAEARLRLIQDEVRWPFHQSIIEAQGGYLEDAEVRDQVAELADVDPANVLELTAEVPRGTAAFSIYSAAPEPGDATALADAAAQWVVANNLVERTEVLELERQRAVERATQLGLEVDRLAAIFDEEADALEELSLAGALNRQAEANDEVAALTDEIELRAPQMQRIGVAELTNSGRERATSATAVGLGVLIIGLALTGRRRSR